MSNVKVERRKQEKYNRKKIEAAKKRKSTILGATAIAVIVLIAGVLGVRIYDDYFRYDATADINPTDISNAVAAVQQAGYEAPEEKDEKEDADADKEDDKAEADKKDDATDADKKDDATDADKKDEATDADKKDDATDADKTEDGKADDKADESTAE